MRYQCEKRTSTHRQLQIKGLFLAAALMVTWSRGAAAGSSPLEALANTAAIVEGRVASHAYTYDPAADLAPWHRWRT